MLVDVRRRFQLCDRFGAKPSSITAAETGKAYARASLVPGILPFVARFFWRSVLFSVIATLSRMAALHSRPVSVTLAIVILLYHKTIMPDPLELPPTP